MENKLIQQRAQKWLVDHDPEAADFWRSLPEGTDFVDAVDQNVRDFGEDDVPTLAIPGRRYRRPLGPPSPSITVVTLAHSVSHESGEVVVYRYCRDEMLSGDLALCYYMSIEEFETQYIEVQR